jgi:hypothetical protein
MLSKMETFWKILELRMPLHSCISLKSLLLNLRVRFTLASDGVDKEVHVFVLGNVAIPE